MLNEFLARAYAKVNFNLKVLPMREDGFHNIESIFQTVNLYDKLTVIPVQGRTCLVECDTMILPPENTITKAYRAFCEISGVEVPGIKVFLEKGIPAGGGLGGGSSDGAAIVRVLEKMCGIKLTSNQLDYIAEKTGSDVFFFLHCDDEGKGSSLVSGRGEIVKRINPRLDLLLVFIFPNVSSSTKEAYALIDDLLALEVTEKYPSFAELESIYRESPKNWCFRNTFTSALSGKYPEIKAALNELIKSGACYSDMSGSGSTVFGVFTSLEEAKKCCDNLSGTWNCELVQVL